ncbi:MAG: TonB family protein [Woeseiaceae bacterium]|nr:TonB family protein [Woeseiaceae bacterium]
MEQFQTQVLLLHSEQSTLDVLSTGFDDRYTVHCATSGIEALNTLGVTPIDVIVSAHDLPGMSGLDALREAKKRSPATIAILMTGSDASDGLEALVSEKEVYQIIRGDIAPEALFALVENATKSARLMALSESANDTSAAVDSGPDIAEGDETGQHIVMETADNGSFVISDGTGQVPALKPAQTIPAPGIAARPVDILALTQDEEFLRTVRDANVGTHKVHHAARPGQAEDFVRNFPVGVLVTDAGLAGDSVEAITRRLRGFQKRLVAIVAGRRDDGEMLMDLINRGQVYRFLLKPVSPGRARLAIEASVKYHLEAPDQAFEGKSTSQPAAGSDQNSAAVSQPAAKEQPKTQAKKGGATGAATAAEKPAPGLPDGYGLDDALDDDSSFTQTMTGIAVSFGKSISQAVSGRRNRRDKPAAAGQESSTSDEAKKEPAGTTQAKREPTLSPAEPTPAPVDRKATNKEDTGGGEKHSSQKAAKPKSSATAKSPTTPNLRVGADERPSTARPDRDERPAERLRVRPLLIGAGCAVVLGVAVAGYLLSSGQTPETTASQPASERTEAAAPTAAEPRPAATEPPVETSGQPAAAASADADFGAADAAVVASPEALALLDRARDARAAGDVFSPAGQNAVELYLAAQAIDADSAAVSQELQEIVVEVYGLAETALLENRTQDASRALRVLSLADPDSQRLNFLTNQLNQQQLRVALDDARTAIRDGRFEDAGRELARAETLAGSSTAEIDALSGELAAARDAQQLDEVLALANERLMDNRLIEPANDNARYYFELAASIEPSNAAAQQGLIALASKLVLRARSAIDAEDFDAAERLLGDARVLDPSSDELVAAAGALESARAAAVSEALTYDDVPSAAAETSATPDTAVAEPRATPQPEAPPTAAATAAEPENDGADVTAGNSSAAAPAEAAATEAGTRTDTNTAIAPAAAANVAPSGADSDADEQPATAGGAAPSDAESASAAPTEQKAELVSITNLTRTRYVPPKYPRAAERRELSGYVDVIFTVTGDGKVADIEIRESEPGDAFVNSAIDAVEKWEFEPVIENGEAVPRRVAVRLSFNFQ